jgi:hypothetical protein
VTALLTLSGQLRLVGGVLVLLGVAHLVLPPVLRWPTRFADLPPLARQVVHSHTFFIGVTCLLLGLLPLALAADLLRPGRLPTAMLAGECAFWGLRWAAQFVLFRPSAWWSSRLFAVGWLAAAALWTWVAGVFGAALTAR